MRTIYVKLFADFVIIVYYSANVNALWVNSVTRLPTIRPFFAFEYAAGRYIIHNEKSFAVVKPRRAVIGHVI